MNDETLNAAIQTSVAKQIIEGLGTEARHALLVKSMTKALTEYHFTSAVEKVVASRAMEIASELVTLDDWSNRITQAIRAGFDDYLADLRMATRESAKTWIHGTEGHYGGSGRVLGHWPRKKE